MSDKQPKSLPYFDKGIKTSQDLLSALSAMMSDVAAKRMTNGDANTICNIASKMLYTVKLQQQFGEGGGREDGGSPMLALVRDDTPRPAGGSLTASR